MLVSQTEGLRSHWLGSRKGGIRGLANLELVSLLRVDPAGQIQFSPHRDAPVEE
jgi:hypothetical protein